MGRLDGKVALISGGARGQGAVEGRMFVREGAAVVLGDVLDDEGKKVEAEIRASGGKSTYVHLNVTREADWRAAIATAVSSYGKLNVLVNNAGILFRSKIEETSEEDWDRIMAVNVKGVFLGTKHAIPAMRQAGGGSIINISSTAGLVGAPASRRPTPRRRAPCGCSRSRRRFSTRRKVFAATPSIPGRSRPT
jgi:NAD(P)-dependent dehydrogenase (short-subunit alcohol dehydrogenase family)